MSFPVPVLKITFYKNCQISSPDSNNYKGFNQLFVMQINSNFFFITSPSRGDHKRW